MGIGVAAQLLVVVALVAVGSPQTQHAADIVVLARHGQQRRGARAVGIVGDVLVVVGILEQRPEVVANHIGRDLAAAHRPTDEGADEVLRVIQHELVTRPRGNRLEGFERVGATLRPVAWQGVDFPVATVEQVFDPCQLVCAHRVGDVGFVHDHPLNGDQPVIEVAARRIVRPP